MTFTRQISIAILAALTTQIAYAQDANSTATSATATLKPASGKKLKGDVTFKHSDSGIEVSIHVEGLKANAVHAIHVHENGACDAPKFESAGGHFNPTSQPHAHPAAKEHHIGDLGNIVADKKGVAKKDLVMARAKLTGETSPIGKSVILHAKPDDLRSQPSGEAGDRIACGIITAK